MSESQEQKEIVKWFRETWPEHRMALRVSQTGASARGGAGKHRFRAQQAKGAVVGESDIAICLPRNGYGSLLIEHKAENGTHKTSDAQKAYIEYHNANGNCGCITKGVDAAKAAITVYMGEA